MICAHDFDLLGSGYKNLDKNDQDKVSIDWHCDFKSGYSWSGHTFYKWIKYGLDLGVDVKVPWELSRFQHLITLGKAYALSGNRKYADEYAFQITDWIKNNPVAFGVNWTSTMDVAIRAVNWIVTQEFFQEKSLFSSDFWNDFYTSLYEHGKFIRNHLEKYPKFTNNHYLADLTGLFFIAVYCPFFKESKKWLKFAQNELLSEIDKQIYEDGCSFEASTLYHRLVLEFLFYIKLLGSRAGIVFSHKYQHRVQKMFDFLAVAIKPNGRIPQIGDNDSGRLLVFKKRPILDLQYLLDIASVFYKQSDFKLEGSTCEEEIFWLFGLQGVEYYKQMKARSIPIKSEQFADAGWYILRHQKDHCFISCGGNGQNGFGGHAHNDKLSFELMLNGEDLIIDPGTYAYTSHPKLRNQFRSTAYHNLVYIDGMEQNEISHSLFGLKQQVKINHAKIYEDNTQVTFNGAIYYRGINHQREIKFFKTKQYWEITDKISSKKKNRAKYIFHFAPDIDIKSGLLMNRKTDHTLAQIDIVGYKFQIKKYEYSPAYGIKMKANMLEVDVPIENGDSIFKTYIRKQMR